MRVMLDDGLDCVMLSRLLNECQNREADSYWRMQYRADDDDDDQLTMIVTLPPYFHLTQILKPTIISASLINIKIEFFTNNIQQACKLQKHLPGTGQNCE